MYSIAKINLFAIVVLSPFMHGAAQDSGSKMAFIVDSIPVVNDPEESDDLLQDDISDQVVIHGRDTLERLGYGNFDAISYIFTKEYRARPDSLRHIPSTKIMELKEGAWFYHGALYSGPVIDYYFSGRRHSVGWLLNGKVNGVETVYYQNGHISLERAYRQSTPEGEEREYYLSGALRQEGNYVNGKEAGVWKSYFPNGAIQQYGKYSNGVLVDSGFHYYSNGKIKGQLLFRNGKVVDDPRQRKINQWMAKSNDSYKEGDIRAAINFTTKVIEFDSTYADAWFSRATLKLNDFQFDAAIADFDKALGIEPYLMVALTNRAFARIRKYQFANGRTLSKNKDVEVRASPDKVVFPPEENDKICHDLELAVLLGDHSKMISDALRDYCHISSMRQ